MAEAQASTKPEDVLRMTPEEYEKKIIDTDASTPDGEEMIRRLLTQDRVEIVQDGEEPPAPAELKPESKEPEPTPEPPQGEPKGLSQEDIERLQKNNQWLSAERDKQVQAETQQKTELAELKQQMAALSEKITEVPKTPEQQAQTRKVEQLKADKLDEINRLNQEISAIPLDDRVGGSEDYVNKSARVQQLMAEVNKEVISAYNGILENGPQSSSELEKLRKELEETKAQVKEYASKADEQLKVVAQTEQQKKVNSVLEEISKFQGSYENFKTEKPVSELDADFLKWGAQLHYLATGNHVYGDQGQQMEQAKSAANAYLKGDPTLTKRAQDAGISKPNDIDKYLEIMDLWRIREQLPDVNGKKPTFEAALTYKMAQTGELDNAILNRQRDAAQATKAAMTKQDTATTIPPSMGGTAKDVGQEMSFDQAKEVIDKTNLVSLTRANDKEGIARFIAAMKTVDPTFDPSTMLG